MLDLCNRRKKIIKEAYRILDDYKHLKDTNMPYFEFIRSYNKLCSDFCLSKINRARPERKEQ